MSKAFLKLERISGLVHPVSEILTVALLLGILLTTAMLAPAQMAVSLAFLLLLYRLQPRIKQLDVDRVALDSLSGAVEEVRSLLDESDKPYLRSGTRMAASIDKGITFDNVSLRHGSGKGAALKHVTCSIDIGETTAFVGPSGAGKLSEFSLSTSSSQMSSNP